MGRKGGAPHAGWGRRERMYEGGSKDEAFTAVRAPHLPLKVTEMGRVVS